MCWIGAAFRRVADLVVNGDALVALVTEHTDLDQLVRSEVHLDFLQHGVGEPFGADQHDGLERMGLGAQRGALGGGKRKGGHGNVEI